jgi:hypothetical protein
MEMEGARVLHRKCGGKNSLTAHLSPTLFIAATLTVQIQNHHFMHSSFMEMAGSSSVFIDFTDEHGRVVSGKHILHLS